MDGNRSLPTKREEERVIVFPPQEGRRLAERVFLQRRTKEARLEKAAAAARLTALADDARRQYLDELKAGGEPVYPAWVDDVTTICANPGSPQDGPPVSADPVVMKEICPTCQHQFDCFHNPYISELRASGPVAVDRQQLRDLVDVVWNEATESTAVPDTPWADRMIDQVFPSLAASAPVAGVARPSDSDILALATRYSAKLRTDNMIAFARALLSSYAAPQASAEAATILAEIAEELDDPTLLRFSQVATGIRDLKERMTQASAEDVSTILAFIFDRFSPPSDAGKLPDTVVAAVRRLEVAMQPQVAKGGGDVALPPLPSPPEHHGHAMFAGSQMIAYARAAVLADRQQRPPESGSL
ncbi:MAG: hypothetical protein ACN6PF_10730 [Achromobacter veterisilvae]